jgi:hypothetical protein
VIAGGIQMRPPCYARSAPVSVGVKCPLWVENRCCVLEEVMTTIKLGGRNEKEEKRENQEYWEED